MFARHCHPEVHSPTYIQFTRDRPSWDQIAGALPEFTSGKRHGNLTPQNRPRYRLTQLISRARVPCTAHANSSSARTRRVSIVRLEQRPISRVSTDVWVTTALRS